MTIYEFVAWSLDFEGCLAINRAERPGTSLLQYGASVTLAGTSLAHLEQYHKRVGFGNVNPNPRAHKNSNDTYVWRLTLDEIPKHLPNIQEFLFLKKRQAQLILALLKIKMPGNFPVRERGQYYTPNILSKMEEFYQECRKLNTHSISPKSEEDNFYRVLRAR